MGTGELGDAAPRPAIARRWQQSRELEIDPFMERAPEGITPDEIQAILTREDLGQAGRRRPGRLGAGRGRHQSRDPARRCPWPHHLLGRARRAPAHPRPSEPGPGRVVGGELRGPERNRHADRPGPSGDRVRPRALLPGLAALGVLRLPDQGSRDPRRRGWRRHHRPGSARAPVRLRAHPVHRALDRAGADGPEHEAPRVPARPLPRARAPMARASRSWSSARAGVWWASTARHSRARTRWAGRVHGVPRRPGARDVGARPPGDRAGRGERGSVDASRAAGRRALGDLPPGPHRPGRAGHRVLDRHDRSLGARRALAPPARRRDSGRADLTLRLRRSDR